MNIVAPDLIPALDPNPLPAPYWVFKLLLVVTFFLHIVAMNFMLGGALLALAARMGRKGSRGLKGKKLRSRGVKELSSPELEVSTRGADQLSSSTSQLLNSSTPQLLDPSTLPHGSRLFRDLAHKLPSLLPATITLGIAPLLFVQVLYGQFFYTSSIILAWPWFLVLVFLTLAYYGFYYVSLKTGTGFSASALVGADDAQAAGAAGKVPRVFLLSVLLIVAIGFIYSNNLTLSQTPARWAQKYFARPTGWNLNLAEPTLFPRFLHFLVAAVAVGGLLLVLIAWANWQRDPAYARYVFEFGGKAFLHATMAQFLVGIAFVLSLPRPMQMLFFGDSPLATLLLIAGIAGALGSIYLMFEALRREDVRLAARYVTAITAAVILVMSILRATLRDAYLKPNFRPQQFLVSTQWSVLPLFLVLFAGGVALWLVMLRRYGLLGGPRAASQAGPVKPEAGSDGWG
jgi:hypothetical protein